MDPYRLSSIFAYFFIKKLQVNAFPITVMFGMCSIFLFLASVLQRRLMVISENQKPSEFLMNHLASVILPLPLFLSHLPSLLSVPLCRAR